MAKNNNGRTTLLRNLVLGISDSRTPNELAALNLLKELIEEIDPSIPLEVYDDVDDGKTPWLFASYSVFYGLGQIKGLARQERMLREKKSRSPAVSPAT